MGVELAALLVAALFLSSGLEHIRSRARFAATLSAYRLMPTRLAWVTATGVIAIEFGGGCLVLAGGPSARVGLLLLAGVAAAGGALITFDLTRGDRSHGCGCFGSDQETLSWWLPIRSGLIALGAAGLAAALPSGSTTPMATTFTVLLGFAFGWTVLIATLRLRTITDHRIKG
jgi:uncharacterized membrane protein